MRARIRTTITTTDVRSAWTSTVVNVISNECSSMFVDCCVVQSVDCVVGGEVFSLGRSDSIAWATAWAFSISVSSPEERGSVARDKSPKPFEEKSCLRVK
jgi:hypothetical protein